MDNTQYEFGLKLGAIFMPDLMARMAEVRDGNISFVHYTSVDAAIKIIKSEEVWLRNARVMNDFSEIQHGQECLKDMWDEDELGGQIRAFLKKLRPEAVSEFEQWFDFEHPTRNEQSFVFSMSEHDHDNGMEDKYGRLSMWRAYGGNPNVALILNKVPFFSKSTAIAAMSVPVIYDDINDFKVRFEQVIRNFKDQENFLTTLGVDFVIQSLRFYFTLYTLSLKHPNFREEKEWRVISSPIFPYPEQSRSRISASIEILGGVAQRVLKIKMKDYEDEGFVGATLPALLKEIVIGPSENQMILSDALCQVLADKGIQDPRERVRASFIPLRR